MTKKLYLKLFVLCCGLLSCDYFPSFPAFKIKNNSNTVLDYGTSNLYPDTSISLINNGFSSTINPGQTGGPFSYTASANGIVEIFLFDKKVINTTPWDTVVAKYLVLKRYDLTMDSIQKLGGVITYP